MLINIPLALLSILVIIMAAAPFFVSLLPLIRSGQGETPGQLIGLVISGLFGSFLLICFTILCIAAVAIVIRPFYEFFVRAGVIRRRGVIESIRKGYHIVRASLGQVVLLYIFLIGIGIAFGLVMIPIGLILIGIPVGVGFVRRGEFGRERGRRRHPVWHTHADHSVIYRRPVSGVRVDRLDGRVSGCDGTANAGRRRTGWPLAVTFFLLPRR